MMKILKKYYKEIGLAFIISIVITVLTNKQDFSLEYYNEIEKIESIKEEITSKEKNIVESTAEELEKFEENEFEKLSELKSKRRELKIESGKLKAKKQNIKEERERKEQEQLEKEEEERKAGTWILESDGYNIWEAYLISGTYSINVNHNGNGNIITYLGDRSNPENRLLINEIGSGNFAATFNIPVEGYYTLTFIHDGAIEFQYQGL